MPDASPDAPPKRPPAYREGSVVRYRHVDTEGSGRILSVGRDGCWVESLEPRPADRRRCTIRHEAILPPDEPGE
jgi:hypothetical protein